MSNVGRAQGLPAASLRVALGSQGWEGSPLLSQRELSRATRKLPRMRTLNRLHLNEAPGVPLS